MTEKETLIARLKELGKMLGRDVNTSGTIQELSMRIAELEEELDEGTDENTGESSGQAEAGSGANAGKIEPPETAGAADSTSSGNDELVAVETRVTLHVDALHGIRNEPVSIVEPGVTIRVAEKVAVDLISHGLAREI
ncbi:DNA-packaging protein FI [Leclercia adecarboxylata]|uniref:DNA-packaging protein FI n=1 Tax=Leclercia adecarboxylata TaxID=83655 RepID=UPI00102E5C7E|nr:DNA-packaging protein FI [Leclercia adecarboxylata]MCZ7841222.1 DNA-packaging protein FI [Leclercia adecarboxylata]QBF87464.1 DNA-packaging protein [Leclercia adecarboxylata]